MTHLCQILHSYARSSIVPMKAIVWMGGSKRDLDTFPPDARREAIGPGVREIRIHGDWGAFRVLYVATRAESIYVLHCFQKKTAKTLKRDLQLARRRFKAIPDNWRDR